MRWYSLNCKLFYKTYSYKSKKDRIPKLIVCWAKLIAWYLVLSIMFHIHLFILQARLHITRLDNILHFNIARCLLIFQPGVNLAKAHYNIECVNQIYSGITNGTVFNKELYTCIIQTFFFFFFFFLHLLTDLFHKDFSSLIRINCSYFIYKCVINE